MAKLILKEFRCVEETDEIDSDSPYFVVFVGKPGNNPTSDVKLIRRESWDNDTDTGELKVPNVTVADGVSSGSVVLAALMEEDDDPDIAGAGLLLVRARMKPIFEAFAVAGASPAQIAANIRPEFVKALREARVNDELLGVKRVPIPVSPGNVGLLNYKGDGGEYNVRFTVA